MEMAHHIHAIQEDLAAAASLASDEATVEAGRRLTQALGSSLHLRLLDVVSEAALALSARCPAGSRFASPVATLSSCTSKRRRSRSPATARRRLLRTHHPAPARRAEGAARGRRQSGGHLRQCLDRARASARARASHPFCSHRPASVRLRGQLKGEARVPSSPGLVRRRSPVGSGLVRPIPPDDRVVRPLPPRQRNDSSRPNAPAEVNAAG